MITYNAANAFCFAALSYRKDAEDKILGLRDGLKCKFVSVFDGALKFGYVTDDSTKTLYLIGRGTGGDTKKAEAMSWLWIDLNVAAGPDGEHNGFQNAGNIYFDWLKTCEVLDKYHTVVTGSHSQGSGYMQRVLLLLSRHYPTRYVDAHLFSSPPYFKRGSELELSLHSRMTVTRYVQPGDPIDSDLLRGDRLQGADIGHEYTLPDIALQDLHVAEAINHSCHLQAGTMLIDTDLKHDLYGSTEELESVKEVLRYAFKETIN